MYSIGKSTVYDILKPKENLIFFADSDSPASMKKRKTLQTANNADLDSNRVDSRKAKWKYASYTGPLIVEVRQQTLFEMFK